MPDYFIISLKHSHKRDRYITIWRPDDAGYAYRLRNAGRYDHANVMAHLGYYNTGASDIAVLCDVVESMAVMTTPATWRKLMAAVIEPPARKMKPAPIYFGRNSENYRRAA